MSRDLDDYAVGEPIREDRHEAPFGFLRQSRKAPRAPDLPPGRADRVDDGGPPENITDLAEHVDRGDSQVYEDLQTLEDYGVVAFEREGRSLRPFVPYERIEYGGTITRDDDERATA